MVEVFRQASTNGSVGVLGKDTQRVSIFLPREVYSIYPISPSRTTGQGKHENGSQAKCTGRKENEKERTG